MNKSTKCSYFMVITSFLATVIGLNASSVFAQHPCDNFPVTTCVVPSSFSAWTINDDLTIATGQTNEPVAHTFYTTDQNPLTTLWYRWTAPQTGIVIVDTQGTNPNALPTEYTNPYVLDTVIAAYTGTAFTNLVRVDESDDWVINSAHSTCMVNRTLPEAIWSSCMRFPVTAGITYNFQVDYLSAPIPGNRTLVLNLRYFIPTAASVSVEGRVKNSFGQGLRRTMISIVDTNGNVRHTTTNSFGYYRFADLIAGETYTISAENKKFQFQNNPRVITPTDDLSHEDFIGDSESFFKRE